MTGIFIDPGYEKSAWLAFDGQRVGARGIDDNATVLAMLLDSYRNNPYAEVLVIEQIASFGMPVGKEVFETVFWSGRFAQAWAGQVDRMTRHEVKMSLCKSARANDATIRAALLDRFGPGRELAIGTKKNQGPLYGISKDLWAALALGVCYFAKHLECVAG